MEVLKVFVGKDFMGENLFVLGKGGEIELLTSEKIDPSAIAFFKENLPPLTREEAAMLSGYSVRPAVPPSVGANPAQAPKPPANG